MKTNRYLGAQIVFTFFLFALFSNSVQAETVNCTAITALPYTISTQGVYCLTGDLTTSMTSGNAITINTNNVTIDLNGHKLGGFAAGAGTNAYGIYANQRQNITIRNGSIRGFKYGIQLFEMSPYTTSSGHLIEDIRADGNTYMGILSIGTGNITRNNQVVNTGGATGGYTGPSAILAYGTASSIVNNDIINTVEQTTIATSYGIYVFGCNGCVVKNNRISNSTAGPGTSYGVYMQSSSNVMAINNRISTVTNGIYFFSGSTGKYRDNLTGSVMWPYTYGTDIGNNN